MKTLRDPERGCPWDCKQSYQSIVPYTLEEVYEVIEAIENKDYDALKDELGDLLFQIVFYAQIASEEKRFEFVDIVNSINDKLTRRHPHVFADQSYRDEEQLHRQWERIKHQERKGKSESAQPVSLMDDIPKLLPELKKAQKIQKRAAKHGFDWPDYRGVLDKIEEEINEIRTAIEHEDPQNIEEEVGDLLFAVVNLARHLKVDADSALRRSNLKFIKRFRILEELANYQVDSYDLDALESFWQQAKVQIKD
jgi:ATP diphosphatase